MCRAGQMWSRVGNGTALLLPLRAFEQTFGCWGALPCHARTTICQGEVTRADATSLRISVTDPRSLDALLGHCRQFYLPGIPVPSVAVDLSLADSPHAQAVVPP